MADVTVKILFFAKSRELVGRSSSTLVLPASCSYTSLVDKLLITFPRLEQLGQAWVLSVNEEYIEETEEEISLSQGDEIAVIPPISGG